MLFSLEALRAKEGDCLLLHWRPKASEAPRLAVIDGGPKGVFEANLQPRLKEISTKRAAKPLPIDVLMVSHVDADHITGVQALLSDAVREVDNNVPAAKRLFKVSRLWHNTFNDIVGDKANAYYNGLATVGLLATVDGEPKKELEEPLTKNLTAKGLKGDHAEFVAEDVAALLASQAQGRDLRLLYEGLRTAGAIKFKLNATGGAAAFTSLLKLGSAWAPFELEGGLQVGIVGPLDAEIAELQNDFDKYIQSKGLSVEALLAAYADESIPNLSSIVCMVGMRGAGGTGVTALLTGDARGDKILSGLEKAGVKVAGQSLHVNVLKVPHHGSNRNVEPAFFKHITADHYVFSGDGKHGNPDRDTLEWLLKARGTAAKYTIHLTYSLADIDQKHKAELQAKNKPWKPAAHSLVDLFAAVGGQYSATWNDGKRCLIELGDEKIAW